MQRSLSRCLWTCLRVTDASVHAVLQATQNGMGRSWAPPRSPRTLPSRSRPAGVALPGTLNPCGYWEDLERPRLRTDEESGGLTRGSGLAADQGNGVSPAYDPKRSVRVKPSMAALRRMSAVEISSEIADEQTSTM